MKNELLKKLTPPIYIHDKLKYLETKLHEKSEYSSLNKYNRSPYMQSKLFNDSGITNQVLTKKKNPSAQPDLKPND
jgi:hypothetical protein